MAQVTLVRVSHSGNTTLSLLLSDVDNGLGDRSIKPGAVYVPVGGYVDLILTDSVAKSMQSGSIAAFESAGHVTVEVILDDNLRLVTHMRGWF
jgi:hypothetical protein